MRSRLALFACLLLVPAAAAFEPSFSVRVKSLDGLIADLRHLYRKAGREEEGKAFEKAMQARTGPKGLEGVDPKKPFGLCAALDAKLDRSPMFLLLPVADEATFLKFVASLGNEPKKQPDGSYRVTVEGIPLINTAMFRLAHGYAYVTLRITDATPMPPADKLPTPDAALGKGSATVALTAHIDRVPASIRKLAVSFLGLQLGAMKDDEKDPVGAAAIDDATALLRALLEEGERLEVSLDLDAKKEELALDAVLTPRKGTALAKDVARLNGMGSVVGGAVAKDAVLSGLARLALPEQMRKAVNALLDDTLKKGLDRLQDHEKEIVEPLAKAVLPSLRPCELDAVAQMRGPGKGGKYTFVVGMGVKDGLNLEKAVKVALKSVPAKSRRGITVDAEKAGTINVHTAEQDNVDEKTKELLGDGPVYFAFRDDALFLAGGEEALAALREALAARAVTARPVRLEVGMKALAPLLAAVDSAMKKAPEAAKEAFAGGAADRVALEISGGERFEARVTLPTAVLTFAAALDRLRK
jgi:hypothetical protein